MQEESFTMASTAFSLWIDKAQSDTDLLVVPE